MKPSLRPVVATALVATISLGLSTQAQATADLRTATVANVAAAPASSSTRDAEIAASYLRQWMFDPNKPPHPLRAKTDFEGPASRNTNLKNKLERRFLQHERQTFGINLGWTDDASPATAVKVSRWFFTRASSDPIRYGDTVALGNGRSPSYVHYTHRTVGIDLDWSHTPRFEWKLLGGKIGQPVRSGEWLAIYNTKARQPLIAFDRTVGADIGWPDSETWPQQIGDHVMRFIKDHWKEGVVYLFAA
jgi:hypothetical protein